MARHILFLALAVLASWPSASRAEAQTCHTPDLGKPSRAPFRATFGALVAGYGSGDQAGDYQALYTGFGYRADGYGAELQLPIFRLRQPHQDSAYGPGDMVLTFRATALRARSETLMAGVELPLMLPTGSESKGLGMGHVMPMPGLWFSFARGPFLLRLSAGYGRAIGAADMTPSEHQHRNQPMRHPIVNPMNNSEFEHAALFGLGLRRDFSVHARWFGAVPIADEHGVVRQVLAGGATASLSPFDVTFELQRPVAGDPFDYKVVLQLGASF